MRIRTCVAVIAALAGGVALAAAASGDEATYLGTYTWTYDAERFGGLSGIELSDDGLQMIAISDRSSYIEAEITRSAGRISAVKLSSLRGLHAPNKVPYAGDAEGLAVTQDRFFVSLEGPGRVWAYTDSHHATALPSAPGFATLSYNSGLEALAIDTKGRLLTMPERSGALTRPFPVWRFDGTRWTRPFEIPRRGGFLLVGADVGPDGRLYVLEREFTGYSFLSRVRRFDMSEDALTNETELLSSSVFQYDNLEGLSVWRDAAGEIRLTMISDDNFNALQKTQLVEYRVPEKLALQAESP